LIALLQIAQKGNFMKNPVILCMFAFVVSGLVVVAYQTHIGQKHLQKQLSTWGAKLDQLNARQTTLQQRLAELHTAIHEEREELTVPAVPPSGGKGCGDDSVEGEQPPEPVDYTSSAIDAFARAPLGGRWASETEDEVRSNLRQIPELTEALESLSCREGVCELTFAVRSEEVNQQILLARSRWLNWSGPMVGIPREASEGGGARIFLARSIEDLQIGQVLD
jgi:hypothetical protein